MNSASATVAAQRVSPRTWWLLAGLAAVASLGMGWDSYFHTYYGTQSYLTPGSSVLLADGTIDFTPGSLLFFPTFGYESGRIPGYASHARVLIPVAVGLLVHAVRRSSRTVARAGLCVAAFAPLLAGGLTQGTAMFLLGLGCAAMGLQATGLINVPRTTSQWRGVTAALVRWRV